jgi:hypothetical protein
VGGAVHGRRADGVIIDDPTKSRADADSKVKREALWTRGQSSAWLR